jgi:hypothetical protein
MKQWFGLWFVASVLCLAPAWSSAEQAETQQQGQAAQVAAPAPAPEKVEGCMPGGGCCGACQASQVEAKPEEGKDAPAAAAGGCPCSRKQQKTM